ncbi:unnamed protein product [Trichogramma brassicae]|uniref:RNA-directed DNA polymerase n=1 Tax=Trichogramma brassicae TaxID=86971 RepID=A0A6H5HSZ5_9HYME|nr:unnamed protein product [Trichogramma brassicae]
MAPEAGKNTPPSPHRREELINSESCPFGLKGAPGTFQQRMMAQEVLTGYLNKFCLVYLDDIVVYSRTWGEHLQHLGQVLERLSAHRLTCATDKIRLGERSIEYLGFIVNPEGNEAKPEYIRSVLDTPPPRTKKQLLAFLGTCNWLQEYVPRLATTLAPLTDLLREKRGLRWTGPAQRAFEEVKTALNHPLRLARPLKNEKYILQTDASSRGMGAVLFQQPEERVGASSRTQAQNFQSPRRNITATSRNASQWYGQSSGSAPTWRDRPFILRTDSRTVTWLNRFKGTRDKLMRWALLLQEFQFTLEHCPGRHNELPDHLSRNPCEETPEDLGDTERILPPTPKVVEEEEQGPCIGQAATVDLRDMIHDAQRNDPHPPDLNHERGYRKQGELIWGRPRKGTPWRLYVPTAIRPELLRQYHDSAEAGHPGSDETHRALQRHFYWRGMQQDVRSHIRDCNLCGRVKKASSHPAPISSHTTNRAMEACGIGPDGTIPHHSEATSVYPRHHRLVLAMGGDIPGASSRRHHDPGHLGEGNLPEMGFPQAILTDNGTQFSNTHEPKITATGRGIPEGHPLPRRASPGQVHSGAREGGHPCPGRLQPGEGEAPPRPAVPGPHSARSSGDPPATQRLEGQEGEREVGSRESTNSCEEDPGEEVAPSIPQILRHRGTDPYCRLTPQHQEEKGPCDSLPHGTF